VSDSGLGFSVKRFIIFIVGSAVAILVFEGMGEVGGNMIKGQVSKTTSKYHPEKNVEDRIKPAFVLEDKVAVANASESADASVADEWNAENSCEQVIEGNDMLQFNLKEMKVSAACANVTVTLKHTGVMAAEVMGHNWVLSTDADFMPVATAAAGAGLANNYVPVGDDRVLAATAIIGGGEETSVTFSIENLSAGNAYTFFCSFPGHYAIMKGSFKVIA
jgi:azurin|tara:strand:- start:5589 stop:6245 length:657 start_codon:yes stop_codon:yes gene_type:complete